jgi:hypothetical protein
MITRLPTSVSCFMSSHLCDKQPRAVTLAFTCLYFFTPFPPLGKFAKFHFSHEILQEGYLVYECNHMCSFSRTCPNRILQNGVRVKLEVFKTEKKVAFSLLYCFQESILTSLLVDSQGWALRAAETILRGMFVCEYVGEVLDEQEANKRRHRFHISSDRCCFCLLYVNFYVTYIKRTLVLSGIGKKVAAICMTLMLI